MSGLPMGIPRYCELPVLLTRFTRRAYTNGDGCRKKFKSKILGLPLASGGLINVGAVESIYITLWQHSICQTYQNRPSFTEDITKEHSDSAHFLPGLSVGLATYAYAYRTCTRATDTASAGQGNMK